MSKYTEAPTFVFVGLLLSSCPYESHFAFYFVHSISSHFDFYLFFLTNHMTTRPLPLEFVLSTLFSSESLYISSSARYIQALRFLCSMLRKNNMATRACTELGKTGEHCPAPSLSEPCQLITIETHWLLNKGVSAPLPVTH